MRNIGRVLRIQIFLSLWRHQRLHIPPSSILARHWRVERHLLPTVFIFSQICDAGTMLLVVAEKERFHGRGDCGEFFYLVDFVEIGGTFEGRLAPGGGCWVFLSVILKDFLKEGQELSHGSALKTLDILAIVFQKHLRCRHRHKNHL